MLQRRATSLLQSWHDHTPTEGSDCTDWHLVRKQPSPELSHTWHVGHPSLRRCNFLDNLKRNHINYFTTSYILIIQTVFQPPNKSDDICICVYTYTDLLKLNFWGAYSHCVLFSLKLYIHIYNFIIYMYLDVFGEEVFV